jgi:hypothetical protein
MPPPPPRLTPRMQALAMLYCRLTARWIQAVVMPQLAEHFTDPAVRWEMLGVMLRRFGAGKD